MLEIDFNVSSTLSIPITSPSSVTPIQIVPLLVFKKDTTFLTKESFNLSFNSTDSVSVNFMQSPA